MSRKLPANLRLKVFGVSLPQWAIDALRRQAGNKRAKNGDIVYQSASGVAYDILLDALRKDAVAAEAEKRHNELMVQYNRRYDLARDIGKIDPVVLEVGLGSVSASDGKRPKV